MATKARAYALQARADFEAYRALGEAAVAGVGEYHRVLLLQMALEKAAKAFLYHAEPAATYPHHVVESAMNRLRVHAVAEATGLGKLSVLHRRLESARPILLAIEAASPSVGPDGRPLTRAESERRENVEYPWQPDAPDAAAWTAPANHDFAVVRLLRRDSRARAAVDLLDRLIRAAETVLP